MKIVLSAVLTGLLTCQSVHAGGIIIGGNYGIATGGEDAASLNNALAGQGIDAKASTSGDIRTAWQAYLTYQFLPSWGIELAYVNLGEASITFEGIDQSIEDILEKIGDSHPRSAQGVKLAATYRFELNKNLQLQSKLGAFFWDTEYTFSGTDPLTGQFSSRTVTIDGTDVSFGLGLVHKLTNEISAHLDWDFYSLDKEFVNTFGFGVSYMF
jgi:hypothetical protein